MQNLFDDLIPGNQPAPASGGGFIRGRARPPAPKTPEEIEAERLLIRRREQEIAQANAAPTEDAEDDSDRRFKRIQDIRTEFNGLPEVRSFNEVRNATRSIQRLATSVPDGDPGRAQADMAMVFAFMRALDPASTVREGEFATAQNSAGVPERIRNAYNQALNGELLGPEQRQGFVRSAADLYMSRAQTYNERARMYQRYFQDLGEDPNRHIQIALAPEREAGQRPQGEVQFADEAAPKHGDAEFATALQQAIANGDLRTTDDVVRFGLANGGWRVDPEQAAAALAHVQSGGGVAMPQFVGMTDAERIAAERDEISGKAGATDLVLQGATLGLTDEAGGVAEAVRNAITAPFMEGRDFDPVGAYQSGRDAERLRLDDARDRLGWTGTGLEIAGGFASGRPTLGPIGGGPALRTSWQTAAVPSTLRGRMAQGTITAAPVGALAGFGYGEGLQESALGTVVGGAGGASLGLAFPAVTAGAGLVGSGLRTITGRNPNVARNAIAQAIADDGNSPAAVGRQMIEAQTNGVPMMLADSGDNVRGLLAASARAPGPARTLARDALDDRQNALGERVTSAIERDLGPASNPHEVAEQLMEQARTTAAPLYEAAYARPGAGAFASQIEHLMERPAMQRALSRALHIAREEGRDPNTLGFDFNEAGDVVTLRSPSWQTYDYIKRGLDDVLQAQPRDPATGAIILDEGTRAIQGTLSRYRRALDTANPEYAAARAAWAGPVRSREAMELGLNALKMTADDLTARTGDLSPGEMDFLRLGVRRAMAERIASLGDTANVTHALLGTGKKRAMLQRLFGGRREFNRFVETLQAEQQGFNTYRTARLGSPTAPNLQDDSALSSAVSAGMVDLATTGLPLTTIVRHALRFRTSEAGRQAQQQLAAMLSEADPARLRVLARELNREAARLRQSGVRAGRRSTVYGRASGQAAGMTANGFTD